MLQFESVPSKKRSNSPRRFYLSIIIFSFFCDSRFLLFIRFFLLQYHISHTGQHIFWHDYDYHTIQYFMSSCDIMRHILLKSSHVSSIIYPELFSSFDFFLGERCDVTEWEAENMSNQQISNWFGRSCCKKSRAQLLCFINTHQFQHVLFHWRSAGGSHPRSRLIFQSCLIYISKWSVKHNVNEAFRSRRGKFAAT